MLLLFRALFRLLQSSTLWLAAAANVAVATATGEISIPLVVATVVGYAYKEGMRYLALRSPGAAALVDETIRELDRRLEEDPPRAVDDDPDGHEALYSTRVRPMLRHLRELRELDTRHLRHGIDSP